jgi:hypothetical protein
MQNIPKSPDYLTAHTGIFLLPSQRPGSFWNILYYGLWPVGISVNFSWQKHFSENGKEFVTNSHLKIK